MKKEKRKMKNEKWGNSLLIAHCFSLFSFLLFVSCADMFQQKIPYTQRSSTLDDLFAADVGEGDIKLAVPAQFNVDSHYSATEIRLTWRIVPGADYYRLERAVAEPVMKETGPEWETPDEGDYEIHERFVYPSSNMYTNVTYTDVILTSAVPDSPKYENKYFYRVSAFSSMKNREESDPTQPESGMLFRAPTGVKATGGKFVDRIEVDWEKSENAASYEIWRSGSATGAALFLRTVPGNQNWFTNEVPQADQGKDFYYMITAVNGSGKKSLSSSAAYGYARIYGAPACPEVRLAADSGRGNSTSQIKIEWDSILEPGIYYVVFRYSSDDSSLTRLTGNTPNPYWTDTLTLKEGVYYYYKVQAVVDEIGSDRVLKSEISDSTPAGFILSPPDTVIAEKDGDSTVTVKWLPAIGGEIERAAYTYKVYTDSSANGSFTTPVGHEVPSSQTDAEGYISATVLSAAGAFFKIATVNGLVESGKSPTVSPPPAAALIEGASQYAFISPSEAANANGVYPVKITWKKPANNDENPAFYHIQRSTRAGSGFSRITGTALRADGTGLAGYSLDENTGVYSFIDRNETARPGRKFYYRVLSLNQLEQGSFPSDECVGWGALTHIQYMLEYNKTMSSALKKLTYMHKPGSTEKLGKETKYGSISGSIYYDGAISGLGARIIIELTNYADFYIENAQDNGAYFILSGNSNTTANMSSNGTMDGTMTCTGMYPGKVYYDRIEIKGGAAGGGSYGIWPDGGFQRAEVQWTVVE